MNDDVDVLIIGGGVGGLALALALAHEHRVTVRVIERRSGPGNINRGDSLLPAVTRHLAGWGALERVRAAGGNPVDAMQVYSRNELLLEAPLTDPDGSPYLVLPHPDIERTLADAARATGRVQVDFRSALRELSVEEGRVRGAVVVDAHGQERCIRARLVVGADGGSSKVRELLGVPFFSVPYDTGYFIIDLERPAAYRDAMRLDLHVDGGVMTMPQKPGMVGVAVLVLPHQLALFQSGSVDERLQAIWRRVPLLEGKRCPPKGAHLYRLHRGHAARYVSGGAALIGDAVHLTNPTAGQGMTMAIEDAAALAQRVAPVLEAHAPDETLDAALRSYEAERQPLNRELVRWSHWMGRFFSMPGAMADRVRRNVFAFGTTGLGKLVQRTIWTRVATRRAS